MTPLQLSSQNLDCYKWISEVIETVLKILVVVVPCGNVFYAQRVVELEGKEEYNALLDFEKFESIFTDVKEEDLADFRAKALQIMRK